MCQSIGCVWKSGINKASKWQFFRQARLSCIVSWFCWSGILSNGSMRWWVWGWPTVTLNYIAEPHGYSVDASRCSRVTNSDPSYPKLLHKCHYEYIRTWYDYIIDRIPETKLGRNCRKRPTRSLHSSWRGRMQRGWSCPALFMGHPQISWFPFPGEASPSNRAMSFRT